MDTCLNESQNNKENISKEEEIRQRTDEYKVLHQVAKILHNSKDTKEMLEGALTALTRFEELEVENKAGIFLADEENKKLKLFSTIGDFSEEFLTKEKEIPYGNCLCGRAAVSKEMIVSNNCFSDKRHDNVFEDMTAHGHYIVPLLSQGTLVGVLFLYTDENPPWYVRSKEILLSIGGLIADAIVSRQREEQIFHKNLQLEELNNLKNKFLGIASHDLRNPLYLIRTFSEVMKEGSVGQVNTKQKELLTKIFNSSNFMKSLLENLLDISKIESGKIDLNKKVNDFNSIVKQQVEIMELTAKNKNISIELCLGKVPSFAFDENAVVQAVANFLSNAIKFSPNDTKVIVQTSKENDAIRFSVKDEGPGLKDEDQRLLFKEFQTLSSKPTGGEKSTGLGLAIVKKLIHLHEGQVGVFSQFGKGSTFYFTLPTD